MIPLIILKLPRTIISQIKNNTFLAQNIPEDINYLNDNSYYSSPYSTNIQDSIDSSFIDSKNNKNFSQCMTAGDIYSEDELNADLQENIG